ncbi:MAG: nuclear transport factor 2 family protein, partial [Dermatophilaceae bacterium]
MSGGVLAVVVVAAGLALNGAAGGAAPPDRSGDRGTRLAQAADIVELEQAMASYGPAQDVAYRNYADPVKAKRECVAGFGKAFAADADISIRLLGGAPIQRTRSLGAWCDFLETFSTENGISSTRHLIGNVEVRLTGRDRAVVTAAGTTPHFLAVGPAATA